MSILLDVTPSTISLENFIARWLVSIIMTFEFGCRSVPHARIIGVNPPAVQIIASNDPVRSLLTLCGSSVLAIK